jgi:outer membrane receptor protein involved in Fe transport
VSVVGGEELERLGATSITEVLNRVGNVNFNYGNPRTGSLTLRGITTGSSDRIEPTIGMELDGVVLGFPPLATGYVFMDIDTVEATRGPSGTRGGKPSNIGRISFNTKAPSFSPEAELSLTYGEWDTLKSTGVIGGPIADGLLAYRASFQREQGDGPWQTHFPDLKGRYSYRNVDRTYGRIQFLLTPTDNFKAKLSIDHRAKGREWVNALTIKHHEPTHYSNGIARSAASIDSAYKKYQRDWFNRDPELYNAVRDYYKYPVNTNRDGAIMMGFKGMTLNLDWKIAGHTLQSITGWRNLWFSADNDEGSPYDISYSSGYITTFKQRSQEFRITSDKGGFVDYVGGLYFLSTEDDSFFRKRTGNDAGAYNANDAQYNLLAASGAGQAMLRDSLNMTYSGTTDFVKNKSTAIYGEADWHLSEPLTLTTGGRVSKEVHRLSAQNVLHDPGVGEDFSKAFGIASNVGTTLLDTTAANRLAQRYFAASYAGLSSGEENLLRNAANVRNAVLSQGSLYPRFTAKPWKGNVYGWHLALSDKINENLTVYGTVQYGEKGGLPVVDSSGNYRLVKKERTTGYEVGFRASLFNNTLILNSDIFVNDLNDFQTTVNVADPVATASYIASHPGCTTDCQQYQSMAGNLPKVRVKGVELDGFYRGIKNLTLRFVATYNDARYAEDTFLNKPSEIWYDTSNPANRYFNAKGKRLNNAPRFTTTIGANYSLPILGDKVFHTAANYKWTDTYYTSSSLSEYDKQKAYGLLDLGIGIGRRDGLFDANLVIKNALDKDYHTKGWSTYTPATPRWIGIIFSSKL